MLPSLRSASRAFVKSARVHGARRNFGISPKPKFVRINISQYAAFLLGCAPLAYWALSQRAEASNREMDKLLLADGDFDVKEAYVDEEDAAPKAFDPETGEINWDCPCLGGAASGPCGEEFKAAFSCFVYSKEEPKGIECMDKFRFMQDCFRRHPEHYADQLKDEEEADSTRSSELSSDSVDNSEDAVAAAVNPAPANGAEIQSKADDVKNSLEAKGQAIKTTTESKVNELREGAEAKALDLRASVEDTAGDLKKNAQGAVAKGKALAAEGKAEAEHVKEIAEQKADEVKANVSKVISDTRDTTAAKVKDAKSKAEPIATSLKDSAERSAKVVKQDVADTVSALKETANSGVEAVEEQMSQASIYAQEQAERAKAKAGSGANKAADEAGHTIGVVKSSAAFTVAATQQRVQQGADQLLESANQAWNDVKSGARLSMDETQHVIEGVVHDARVTAQTSLDHARDWTVARVGKAQKLKEEAMHIISDRVSDFDRSANETAHSLREKLQASLESIKDGASQAEASVRSKLNSARANTEDVKHQAYNSRKSVYEDTLESPHVQREKAEQLSHDTANENSKGLKASLDDTKSRLAKSADTLKGASTSAAQDSLKEAEFASAKLDETLSKK